MGVFAIVSLTLKLWSIRPSLAVDNNKAKYVPFLKAQIFSHLAEKQILIHSESHFMVQYENNIGAKH